MGRVAFAVAVFVLALAPAAAGAAVRYASPAGTGEECSQSNPCTLETAVGPGAVENDEVVVGPGTYALGTTLSPTVALTIHGTAGQRPQVVAPLGSPALSSSVTLALSDLAFQSRDADTLSELGPNSAAERIEVLAITEAGSVDALQPGSGFILRDSILRAYGTNGSRALYYEARETGVVTLRNVTAIAGGPGSTALAIKATDMGPDSGIEATNVIADAAIDVSASADPSTRSAVHLVNSNYNIGDTPAGRGTIDGSGRQFLLPKFVNAPAGDFRQAPGSPTIDAGLTDAANGPLDLDGNARTAGAATDIGAYESSPAPAPAGAPVDAAATGTIIGALRLSRTGVVRVTLACPASETRCSWSYQLSSRRRVRTRGKRRVIRFGSGKASAPGARRVTVAIKLSKRNFRLIRSKRRLAVKLTVRMTDAAANIATTKRTATLKAPKRAARKPRAALQPGGDQPPSTAPTRSALNGCVPGTSCALDRELLARM